MKRVVALVFASLVALSSVCFATGDTGEFPEDVSYSSVAPKEKVRVDYYYGYNCSHCLSLEPWLDEFEKSHSMDVEIVRHEIVLNLKDYNDFVEKMNLLDIKAEDQGTPTIVINRKALIGTNVIQQGLAGEVDAAKAVLEKKVIVEPISGEDAVSNEGEGVV